MTVSAVPIDPSGHAGSSPSNPTLASQQLQEGTLTGLHHRLLWFTTALTVFFGPLDVSADGAIMEVGLDAYVLVKLMTSGVAALLAGYGILTSWKIRESLLSVPGFLIFGLLALVGLATPIATSGASLPTTLINLAYVGFAVTALVGLGLHGMIKAGLTGMVLSASCAWFLYLFLPRYGVFPELLADGLVVERLGGVAHPNSVGRTVLLGSIIVVYLYRKHEFSWITASMLLCLFLSAAWFAWSRTAIVAGSVASVVLFFDQLQSRLGKATLIAGAVLGLALITMVFALGKEDRMIERVLSKISKSGDASEVTSGTGRSEIWRFAMDLIRQRPVIGHGFNAAPILMVDHSQSTHNAVLHASLSGGILAGLLMVCLLTWNLFTAFHADNLLIRAMTTYLVISCLMEETVLETFPGPCTLMWLLCLFYPLVRSAHLVDVPPHRPVSPVPQS